MNQNRSHAKTVKSIEAALQGFLKGKGSCRCLIGFSGGLDSSVLLHAATQQSRALQSNGEPVPQLLAIHVNHGLQADADAWAAHCADVCVQWQVGYRAVEVELAERAKEGLEAAARKARYEAFAYNMQPNDCLLTAHHLNDQAETFLLNLMRGSGVAGLAGMAAEQAWALGTHARPLLGFSREQLLAYAQQHDLKWLEDPSNQNTNYRRNHLRHIVMPALEQAWPQAQKSIAQATQWQAEALQLNTELAALDLAAIQVDEPTSPINIPDAVTGAQQRVTLSQERFLALSAARQRNVMRHAFRQVGLDSPPRDRWTAIEQLLRAQSDAKPLVQWANTELRRHNGMLYLQAKSTAAFSELLGNEELLFEWDKASLRCQLPEPLGVLRLSKDPQSDSDWPEDLNTALSVRARKGGERYLDPVTGQHKSLKNWLQSQHVPPWLRSELPLIYWNNELIACADRMLSVPCIAPETATSCWRLQWTPR